MKNWRKLAALLLAAVMCFGLLAGCGSSSDSSDSGSDTGEETGEAAEEGTDGTVSTAADNVLHYQIDTLIDSLNPQIANDGVSFSVLAQIMEGLYVRDEEGTPILGVADSEDVSEDGLTHTFHIREDAVWSDGTDVTADDFVYAWQTLADPATASEYQFFVETACIENATEVMAGDLPVTDLGVTAEDDKTLVVTLSTPCAVFDSLMTFASFLPVNRAFAEECGSNFATSPDTILCNGAFTITDYEPSATTIKADRNETYYDADAVSLDGVEWKVIQDAQTAAMSYESGDLDVVTLTGDLIEQYSDSADFSTTQDGYMWFVNVNLQVEYLDNLNLRLALAKSFDKDAIVNTILKDGSLAANYYVPKDLSVGPDGVDFREEAGDYDNWTYDVEAAQSYWEAAKEELGVDTLSFDMVVEDNSTAQSVAQFLQSEWQNNLEGLTINLTIEPKKARLADMEVGDYELGFTRWGPDYADPMTDLDAFITDASVNYGLWSNEEYDELILSAKYGELALDTEARWSALLDCEQMMADDCVILPVYQQSIARLISPGVDGIYFYNTGANYYFKYVTKQ